MNAVAVPIGSEETLALPEPAQRLALPAPETALAPDLVPRDLRTQATHRLLVASGIPSGDAAALIGYAVGLTPGKSRWNLKEVNRLLFLRDLYVNTAWGESERQPA